MSTPIILPLLLKASLAMQLNCLLRERAPAPDKTITVLEKWSAPVINSSVYYYAEINAPFTVNNENIKIYSRYSISNGHFFIEVRNWKKNTLAYADSYQSKQETPHMQLRFDPLFFNQESTGDHSYEVECVMNKSSQ